MQYQRLKVLIGFTQFGSLRQFPHNYQNVIHFKHLQSKGFQTFTSSLHSRFGRCYVGNTSRHGNFDHNSLRLYSSFDSSKSSNENSETFTEEELKVLAELEKEESEFRQQKNDFHDSSKVKLKDSISQSYVPFEDHQRIIQDVIDEIWNPIPQPQKPVYQPPEEFLIRGKTGVFELSELIDLLREENASEILTISLPKELDYADYMVIVTAMSPKHLLAVTTYVRKRFKMKNLKNSDVIPNIVTRNGQQGWLALDLGNIVLHLFLQVQRDHYDLEMLWTVGPMFDDLCNTRDSDIIELLNMIK